MSRLAIGNGRLVFLQYAVFYVFTQLACKWRYDGTEIFAFVEGVGWEADEHSVFAVHYAEAADLNLVVQHDCCKSFDVPQARGVLERIYLNVCDCQAVEHGGVLTDS